MKMAISHSFNDGLWVENKKEFYFIHKNLDFAPMILIIFIFFLIVVYSVNFFDMAI